MGVVAFTGISLMTNFPCGLSTPPEITGARVGLDEQHPHRARKRRAAQPCSPPYLLRVIQDHCVSSDPLGVL